MSKKLTNEIIDFRLFNRNIKRIDNYIDYNTPIMFACKKCNYNWKVSPGGLSNKKSWGCPNCSRNVKLSNKIIDERLINRNIQRIGECVNTHHPIEFKCLNNNCNYIWLASPKSVTVSNTGCPSCAGLLKLTNEIIDNRLKNRNIKRIDNYINSRKKIKWKCLNNNCLYEWFSCPVSVINSKSGCPKCANQIKITNEIIDKRLANKTIIRIGNCINSATPIEMQCLNCKLIWKSSPSNIFAGYGCPKCKHKNEKIIHNYLKDNNIIFEYQKHIKQINSKEIKKYKVDFYLPNQNIIIEYNGKQHYNPVRFGGYSIEKSNKDFENQQKRDEYIRLFCKENNIKLIEIDGREYFKDKLNKYIENILLNKLIVV